MDKEYKVIGGVIPNSIAWSKAMANANKANQDYVPNYMKHMSKPDLEKLIAKLGKK